MFLHKGIKFEHYDNLFQINIFIFSFLILSTCNPYMKRKADGGIKTLNAYLKTNDFEWLWQVLHRSFLV